MKFPSKKNYRKHFIKEENKLNSLTGIFLAASGILLILFGLSDDGTIRLISCLSGTTITFFWVLCSWQSWKVIRDLRIDYNKIYHQDYLSGIIRQANFRINWLRPGYIIAKLLPVIFFITWLLLLIVHVLKLSKLLVLL